MAILRSLPAALLALLLAVSPRDALAQSTPIPIKKIVLIACPEPAEFAATTGTGGAMVMVGGLVGGIVAAVISEENSKKLTAALASDPVDLGRRITDAVETQLRGAGYEVVRVAAARDKPHKLLENYSGIADDADAYLDIIIKFAGYHRVGLAVDYAPGVRIGLRLVGPDRRTEIADDGFGYEQGRAFRSGYAFGSNYKFADMDSLREQLPRAKEGLLASAEPLAADVVGKVNDVRDGKVRPASGTSADPAARVGPEADSTR
ncbi:MAG: hypothetical protein IT562_08070 [Alphaproteobacteria bacterium]|nr:hypothetical protein [Alphaproteobacteria bacterium]